MGRLSGRVALAVLFLSAYNGANFIAFKIGVGALPAVMLGALRFSAAALILLPVAAWRVRGAGLPPARQMAAAGLLGVAMLVGGQTLTIWGVRFLPAGVASVFGASPPLFLALFDWAALREPLGRRQLAGVCVGFAGIAFIGWNSAGAGGFRWIGAGAVLGASAVWAAGSLVANRVTLPADPVVNLVVQLLAAGAVLFGLTLGSGTAARVDFGSIPLQAWEALAFLVVVSTVLGYSVFSWLNHAVSSTIANAFCYVAPVIAIGLAALLLREPVGWAKATAAAIALAGVALMISGEGAPRPVSRSLPPGREA